MRRSVLVIVLVLAGIMVPAALFASVASPDLPGILAAPQPWQPQISELGQVSFGVFGTAIDSLFSLFHVDSTAGFGTVTAPMIVGGVDNLFGSAAVAGIPFGGGGTPFYAGYYSSGANPFSVYAYLNQTGNGGEGSSTTVTNNTNTYTIAPATYNWVQNQTVTTSQPRPVGTVNNDFLQALYGAGPFQGGVGIKLNIVDNALAANNGTTVVSNYYNTTPGAAPTQTLDYTQTTVSTSMVSGGLQSTFDIAVGVPLLLKMGPISHYISVGFEDTAVDGSSSTTVTYSSPKDPSLADPTNVSPLPAYQNTTNAFVGKGSTYSIPIGYALFLPPLISGSKKNQFIVTADTAFNISTAQVSSSTKAANFTYAGGGVASTPGTATDTEVRQTWSNGLAFRVGAGAVHSLYFTPATGVEYGIVPTLYLDYMRYTGANPGQSVPLLATDTNTATIDTSGIGTPSAVNTTITTTTYTNAVSDTTGVTTTDQFDAIISIPMVLKIMPQGWVFGFTLGTTPQGWYNLQLASTASRTKSQTISTQIGTATPTVTTAQFAATDPASSVTNIWSFQAVHTLGLNFVFDTVTMDVNLNFKTVASAGGGGVTVSNIFDFNNLTIQAAVPLK